jgi:hypothetical protein
MVPGPTNLLEEDLTTLLPQSIGAPAMLVNILGITDDAKWEYGKDLCVLFTHLR